MDFAAGEKVQQISARFGGAQVTFRLEGGAHWGEVHDVWLGPLVALHQQIIASLGTHEQITRVLALAYVGAPQRALAHVPEVDAVLSRHPVGTFHPLAARVLEAHIFGIDPALAVWNESEAFA